MALKYIIGFMLVISSTGHAQHIDSIIVNENYVNEPLNNILSKWSDNYKMEIYFKPKWLEGIVISKVFINQSLSAALTRVLAPYDLDYVEFNNKQIIIVKSTEWNDNSNNVFEEGIIVIGRKGATVKEATLSGVVKEGGTGEELVGATVSIGETGAITDAYGYYSFKIRTGRHILKVSYLGWKQEHKEIQIYDNGKLDLELFESVTELQDVVVRATAENANITDLQMSSVNVSLNSIKELPTLLGEVDIFRTIQQLPGVSTVGEGSAGFNVRGGDIQENLILLDNIPIYNSSHVFGFFSTVNADLVDNFRLIKGGMDAKYGGRTSAVLDMQMKEGNSNNWEVKGTASNLASKLMVEGPLVKHKASISVGGRLNYSDYLLKLIKDPDISESSAQFYDIGGKIVYNINRKNRLATTAYISADQFQLAKDTTYNYSIFLTGIDWIHVVNKNLTVTSSASISQYKNEISGRNEPYGYKYNSGIQSYHFGIDGIYSISTKNTLTFGVGYNLYSINPGEISPTSSESNVVNAKLNEDNSDELVAYVSNSISINQNLAINLGLRFSHFTRVGEADDYVFEENVPRTPTSIVDTISFAKGDRIENFKSIEPRISLQYLLKYNISVKASYQRTRQFIHQINNTVALSPFAYWKNSKGNILPQLSDQWAIGYFQNFKDNIFETSVELYYRKSQDIVGYKNLANLTLNEAVETEILPAEGKAYGIELFIRKQIGRLGGWLSYTYSRSFVTVSSVFSKELINNGNEFPSDYDKPHILSTSVNYELSRRWVFASSFSYSTGRPISYPTAQFSLGGISVVNFSERNQYRIPDYHRLDISFTLRGNLKKNQKLKTSWTFGVYNLYGRKNPFTVFFGKHKPSDPQLTPYQLSILAQPIPSISLNIQWK